MSSPTYRKRRTLVDQSITATINLPAFPSGPNSDDFFVFAGAFGGAHIGGLRLEVEDWAGLTSVDAKLQHSGDGATWTDVHATAYTFTQATGNTTEDIDVTDDTFLRRFLRIAFTVVGAGSATVQVYVDYAQSGPRDRVAPPGIIERTN